MNSATSFLAALKVFLAIVWHRLYIPPLKDNPTYPEQRSYRITEQSPAYRLRPCTIMPAGRCAAVQKSFAPPGWIVNSTDESVARWKKMILQRPFNYCDALKKKVDDIQPTRKTLLLVA